MEEVFSDGLSHVHHRQDNVSVCPLYLTTQPLFLYSYPHVFMPDRSDFYTRLVRSDRSQETLVQNILNRATWPHTRLGWHTTVLLTSLTLDLSRLHEEVFENLTKKTKTQPS